MSSFEWKALITCVGSRIVVRDSGEGATSGECATFPINLRVF